MTGAPAIVKLAGGSYQDELRHTNHMFDVATKQTSSYSIPKIDFKDSPTGRDIRKVIENNLPPIINTGIAHKKLGADMVGAGIVSPPKKML